MRRDWLRFLMRWQQVTGPMMAKGLEDHALYVYNPLTSLNEVGRRRGGGRCGLLSPVQPGARRPLAALNECHGHARYQAGRGHTRAHSRHLRVCLRVAAPAAGLEPRKSPPPRRDSRPEHGDVAVPGLDGRLAAGRNRGYGFHGAHPRIRPQGGAREQGADQLAAARRRLRTRAGRVCGTRARPRQFGFPRQLHELPGETRPLRGLEFARPGAAEDGFSRNSRFLPGHRALGPHAGRSRQPPGGQFRPQTEPSRPVARSLRGPAGAHRGSARELARRAVEALRHLESARVPAHAAPAVSGGRVHTAGGGRLAGFECHRLRAAPGERMGDRGGSAPDGPVLHPRPPAARTRLAGHRRYAARRRPGNDGKTPSQAGNSGTGGADAGHLPLREVFGHLPVGLLTGTSGGAGEMS